jgi:hypothetical protein
MIHQGHLHFNGIHFFAIHPAAAGKCRSCSEASWLAEIDRSAHNQRFAGDVSALFHRKDMTMRSCVLLLSAGLFMTSLLGCSKSDRPDIAFASGRVTLDGNPVEGASVSFEPVGGGRPCSGMTDADGVYKITSYEPFDGAPVGDHNVAIIKISGEGSSVPAGEDPTMSLSNISGPGAEKKDDKQPETIYLVPRKYGSVKTSNLKVTVPSGGSSELNFELTAR